MAKDDKATEGKETKEMKAFLVISVLLILTGVGAGIGYLSAPDPVPVPAVPTIEVPAERLPVDCTDAVNLAVISTEERCARYLDCRNIWRHPDNCSTDCKYHALERGLSVQELDEEWRDYPTEKRQP